MPQYSYIGVTEMLPEFIKQPEDENTMVWSLQDKLQSTGLEEMEKKQEEGSAMKKNESIQHLTHSISDHCPLLFNTNSGNICMGIPRFKLEAWWTIEESIEQEIKESWKSST
ncbi:hypothetical protein Gohar_018383, partial [Gossypium harknessii]|nr:hypothetical protein [Gossypium harknessii]